MTEDSAFFSDKPDTIIAAASEPVLIHRSEGGWSELYRIDKNGRFRVLKALQPEYRGVLRYETLLRKEFEIGYSLSHTGICEVYAYVYVHNIGNCIEMEWVDGMSLSELMEKQKVSAEQTKNIVLQLCDTLQYLHAKQVIHRDLKPSNVMITHNGGHVKLIDFGLSDSDSYTVNKAPAGTHSFASPELLSGSSVDYRTDIYSLGKLISLMSPDYSSVVRKCTRKNPDDRYGSVEEVRESMRKRRFGFIWPVLLLALVAIVAVTYMSYGRDQVAAEPAVDTEMLDPAAIDELFQQATDLIELRSDQ